ncbi:MAG: 2Fe-2S iron-sulfur cluster-binding protein [Rhodococcus sp. (in: high G+C Gram-positive bacteria)]
MSGLRFHTVQISSVVDETHDAKSIVFCLDESQRSRFDYRPGQFLTVRIPSDRGAVARCYSLSSSPHTDSDLKITVKRTEDGYGSNWLCDNATEGTTVDVLEPSGTFTPTSFDGNFLLIAGGSGITPVMSIVKSVLKEGLGTVTLLYANRDEMSVVFADELSALVATHPDRITVLHWLQSVQGLPTSASLDGMVAGRAIDSVFVCGPKPFMKAVRETAFWRALPRSAVHIERFASLGGDPFEDAVDFAGSTDPIDAGVHSPAPVADTASAPTDLTVTLDGATHSIAWPRDVTLLELLESRGLPAPSSCKEGACSACECRLLDGRVIMAANQVLEDEDLAEGYVLACQSRPVTDSVTVSYDD